MKRKSIITVLALVLVLALSLSIFSACNKKHKYSSEWKFDEKTHWHECTTKKHTDTSEKLPHEFKEEIVKAADYGVVGEKKFTCEKCGYSYTQDIDALGAKDNEIVLVAGKTLGKEYDGEVISITKDDFVIEGNRAPTIMFKVKGADDNTYTATAPKKVGEYTVKVSVRATAEWKSATKTFDFAITPMVISVAWEHPYDNKNVFSGEPAELLAGEEAMITVTMSSANVGAEVQSFEITGKDAGNYSLAREDVNVEIIKADINFEISNASAFNELFFVGATNIPDPTTNYVEIGTGYGERTIEWIMHLGDGVWSRTLTKDEVLGTAGEYRVRIKYAEGDNYNFGATQYVSFTVKKESVLTIKNIIGPDGNPIAGITDSALGIKYGEDRINMQAQIAGGMKAHYKCTVCGKYFDADKNETTEEALKTPISPYYGHSFGFWVEEQYATCQAPGRKGYKHCSICDKNYDASNTVITDFVIPVNPDGHELGDLVAEVPATCKDTGVKAHRDCNLCGKHCDPITRKEIADLTIPTTNNHTYGELIPEVPATTEDFGVKEHKDCTVCGKHFDKDGGEITELKIAKIGTHNVVINGESKFYAHGESVTVTAEDKEGKEFVGWQDASGNIVSTKKEYTFVVKDEMVLTAVYQDKAPGGGTIDGEIAPAPDKNGLSGGQIAGIVIGSLAGVGIVGFAIFWFVVKKKTFAELISAIKALFNKKQ